MEYNLHIMHAYISYIREKQIPINGVQLLPRQKEQFVTGKKEKKDYRHFFHLQIVKFLVRIEL